MKKAFLKHPNGHQATESGVLRKIIRINLELLLEHAEDLPSDLPNCRLCLLHRSPCHTHLYAFWTQGAFHHLVTPSQSLSSSFIIAITETVSLDTNISNVINTTFLQKRDTLVKELAVLPESEHLKRPKLDSVG